MPVVKFGKRRAVADGYLPQQLNVTILNFRLVHGFGQS